MGSLPRRHTFIQQMRGRSTTLLVDAGDALFGTPSKRAPSQRQERSSMKTARVILEAYNFMGYEAMALGPGDIQYGVDKLKNLLKTCKFPIVCANLVEKSTGKPVFHPYVILEKDGVKFGIYGVSISSINPTYKKRNLGERYDLLDPLETTRKIVAELQKNCDYVIGLSHLNKDKNYEIARTIQGIDVLVDPYCQFGNKAVWITEGEYLIEDKGIPIARIDGQGSRVGVFDMEFDAEKNIESYLGYDYPLEPQIMDHPQMVELLKNLKRGLTLEFKYDPELLRLLGDDFLGQETCGTCHESQFAFWKSTKHSTAFATLVRDGTEFRSDCIECHTSGYGVTFAKLENSKNFADVQCERCHGIDADHAENPKKNRFGKVNESSCWGCHNPAITKKDFDYFNGMKNAACPKMERQ